MLCTRCKSTTTVIDTRRTDNAVRRKRRCKKCRHAYWTREEVEVIVVEQKKPPKPKPKSRRPGRPRHEGMGEREVWDDLTDHNISLRELGLD